MRKGIAISAVIFMLGFSLIACKHKLEYVPSSLDSNGSGRYPDKIAKIIVGKCATAGCHNAQSYQFSAGLRLDTWEHLFNGSSSGAVIVPYSSENSSLLFYINPDSSFGLKAEPQMPLNAPPLTEEEYLSVKEWVDAGAPDKDGNIPFASNPSSRQKVYITNQGCDLVAVIDAEKKVVMRYINVGNRSGYEVPHYLKASSDGYAYVSFLSGTVLQKIDMRTDQVVGEAEVGSGQWNAFQVSDDGKRILLGDYTSIGHVLLIDAVNMRVIANYKGVDMHFPHGVAGNAAFDTFYVTSQFGNMIYKLTVGGDITPISIDGNPPSNRPSVKRDPHEIMMVPDRSKYFLSCDASNEIRVMDVKTDKVLDSIRVGIFPQTMAMSKTKPYLFVTCTEDNSTLAGFRGSVYVINYNTHEVVRRIDGPFYQPHGISVDDRNGLLYVSNRNYLTSGPAPHHASACGGRNGYYLIYDLNTLERLPRRYEMSVDPYSSDIRFAY